MYSVAVANARLTLLSCRMPSARPERPKQETGLRPQLSAPQMAMVAVGGSISTGLLLGSGAAIHIAGPAVLFSFLAAAFLSYTVAMAVGELACAHPAAGSFGVYGDLYLNEWSGFIGRAGYWAGLAVSIGAEMIASATYMAYWFAGVPAWVWVVVFSVALMLVNLSTVGSYGRFEFWFAMIKVAAIAAFILIGASLLLTRRVAPQYTAHGGFFPQGMFAPLFAITYAVYSFGGVEMVAVTSGESRSLKDIPRAVRLTFLALTVAYLGATAVLLGILPWNSTGTTESPFVTVFRLVGIPGASHVTNFVVLTAALSGANATLYVCSRMLFSMGRTGWAPPVFGRLNASGSPRAAVIASGFGIVIAFALSFGSRANAFGYLLGGAFTGLISSWLVSLAAHVNFRRRKTDEEIAALPLRSPLGLWGSVIGFALASIATLQTWLAPRANFYSGMVYVGVLTIAYFMIKKLRASTRAIP